MGKRTLRFALPLAIISCIAAIFISGCRTAAPSHHGKTLAQWLKSYEHAKPDSPEEQQARAAVLAIGSNGLPYLLKHLESNDSIEAMESADGFKILGPAAAPAIPELNRLLTGTNELSATLAATALGGIGAPALDVLLMGATNGSQRVRVDVSLVISELGTNAAPVVPIYLAELKDNRWQVRQRGVTTLGFLHLAPDSVVPALTERLFDPAPPVRFSAATALAEFGPDARAAIPELTSLLSDDNEDRRNSATNALMRIAPEVLTNAPPK